MHTLNTAQLAAQIGKSKDWVYRHWKELVEKDGMPPPIQKGQLIWSSAQIYTWIDRNLQDDLKASVTAYRAALEAAKSAPTKVPDEKDWGAILQERLEKMG